jgi:transcriptional/translational regulatory protein YebC/TACO1
MEQLDNLPPLAIIVFGVTLAVIFGVRYLGLFAGANAAPEKSMATAQVAAVIVDPTALNRATAAVEALNMTFMEMNMVAKEKTRVDRETAEELSNLREEIRIHRELQRR